MNKPEDQWLHPSNRSGNELAHLFVPLVVGGRNQHFIKGQPFLKHLLQLPNISALISVDLNLIITGK